MALRISKQLPSGLPQLTPACPLTHWCITLWSGVLSAKFGGHRAFLRNLISGWPWLTPAPEMSYTLIKGSSHQIWWPYGISKQFEPWLTLADPCMTFDPSNALHSGQGFFPPNLVTIGHCEARWPLLDLSWPLHDLWPQQCITLWSGVLSTKFGGHRALLSKLTPTWRQLTFTWPLTPAMHYAFVRGSSHHIWWP